MPYKFLGSKLKVHQQVRSQIHTHTHTFQWNSCPNTTFIISPSLSLSLYYYIWILLCFTLFDSHLSLFYYSYNVFKNDFKNTFVLDLFCHIQVARVVNILHPSSTKSCFVLFLVVVIEMRGIGSFRDHFIISFIKNCFYLQILFWPKVFFL